MNGSFSDGLFTKLGATVEGAAVYGDGLFGLAVSMSADGSRIVVGARDGGTNGGGQVRVFEYDSGMNQWNQLGVDFNADASGDDLGAAVSISADGSTIAIGAPRNDGGAMNGGHGRVYDGNPLPVTLRGLGSTDRRRDPC